MMEHREDYQHSERLEPRVKVDVPFQMALWSHKGRGVFGCMHVNTEAFLMPL